MRRSRGMTGFGTARARCTLTAVLLFACAATALAGEEVEHRHVTFVTARAIGFSDAEAELIAAAAWSLDTNTATIATPETEAERRVLASYIAGAGQPLPRAGSGESLAAVLQQAGYLARGVAFHALCSPEARRAIMDSRQREIAESWQRSRDANAALVQVGMLAHFAMDAHVHPEHALFGHLVDGHSTDYASSNPEEYTAGAVEVYRALRAAFQQMHPERAAELARRESVFGIDASREHGIDGFANRAVEAIVDSHRLTPLARWGDDPERGNVRHHARANLATEFAPQFARLDEPAPRVPEFRPIVIENDAGGTLRCHRAAGAGAGVLETHVSSAVTAVERAADGSALASARRDLVAEANSFGIASEAARSLRGLATGRAPIEIAESGVLELGSAAASMVRQSAGDERIGGVKLEVVFDLLSSLDEPLTRARVARSVTDPVLVSLRRVLAQVHDKAWPSDATALSLGGLTRIHGWLFDPARDDIVLIGVAEPGCAPIGLENFVTGLAAVWRDGRTPTVSLDPRPDQFAGPQYPRVIGVDADTSFARIMLDADYAMKRVMLGAERVPGGIGFEPLTERMRDAPDTGASSSRFWFVPVRFAAHDIRLSASGDMVLFDTQLRVLTEAMALTQDGLVGLGRTDPIADEAAANFTACFPALAATIRHDGRLVFHELRGLLDVVTFSALWRMGGSSSLLAQLADLPVPRHEGRGAYAGLHRELELDDGKTIVVQGGALLRRWVGQRHFDGFDDVQTRRLRAEVAAFGRDERIARHTQGITLLLAQSSTEQTGRAETALERGSRSLAEGDVSAAIDALTSALSEAPEMVEALCLRASARMQLKQFAAAAADLDAALALVPNDAWTQGARFALALETGEELPKDRFTAAIYARLEDVLTLAAERALAGARYSDAVHYFTRALGERDQLDPDQEFMIFLRRGYAHEMAGELAAAEDDYREADQLLAWAGSFGLMTREQLLLGHCRVALRQDRFDLILAEDSIFDAATLTLDAAARLEAKHLRAMGKSNWLIAERRHRIHEGIAITRAWSEKEVAMLRAVADDLDSELVGSSQEVRVELSQRVRDCEELITSLRRRADKIERLELGGR